MRPLSTGYVAALTLMWGALSFHWTVLTNNILPTRALQFADETTKGSVLGWVTVAGALVATLTGPIIGVLSDRSRSRWGRRRPFLIAGMLLNVPALCALLAADSLAGFVLGYMAVQFCVNVASGPATALIPDQVPRVQQGQATGVAGLADVVGRMTGSLAGGLLIAAPALSGAIAPWLGILPAALRSEPMLPLVGLLVAVTVGSMLVTAATVREAPPALVSARRGERLWRAFVFDVRAAPAFAWLLASRLCVMLAVTTLVTFLLYYVRDYLGVSDVAEANARLGYLYAVSAVATLPTALGVGVLIDRHGHRKAWVYASTVGLALVAVAFLAVGRFATALLVAALFGVCWGGYFTSSWALALVLLPRGDEAAKFLGIWNIAATVPAIVAPGVGGMLLDSFNRVGPTWGYTVLFLTVVLYNVASAALLGRVHEPPVDAIPAHEHGRPTGSPLR